MNKIKVIIASNSKELLFYGVWFLLAIWQARNTELLNDEAYYWKFSQFLDWGYFDHPPMVALLVKIGSTLLSGEIGVRLLFVLLGTATIYLIQQIIRPKNKLLFFVIVGSVGLLYFTSFLALPDVPLLFFSTLFLLVLKQYLTQHSWQYALYLGLITACLLLSKYHGFVIVFAALLSNLYLLKKRSFYVVIVTAIVLVLPHFLWQFNHDFPSIQYHFHDRNLNAYSIFNTLEYILIQLVLFGPFVGFFLWIGFFRSSNRNQFEKTLWWQIVFVFLFFLALTFNGKVQGHWTGILAIPLIYFGYQFLSSSSKFRKWTFYQFPVTILIVLIIKLGLVYDLPLGADLAREFSDYKGKLKWAEAIQKTTKKMPVVFMNSYQNASVYEFYTRQPSMTLTNVMSRKNQYDLWHYEDSLRGKTVAIIPNYKVREFDTLADVIPFSQFHIIKNFQSYSQVKLEPINWSNTCEQKEALNITLKLLDAEAFNFSENLRLPSYVSYSFFEDNHLISQTKTNINCATINRNGIEIELQLPHKKGIYQVYFSIQTGWLPPGLNSKVYELIIS